MLLLTLAAGCGDVGAATPAPAPARTAATWQRFAVECPELVNAPYGLPTRGKPSAADHVDDAGRYEERCEYAAPGGRPLLTLHVTVFRGADGATRVEQEYLKERTAADSTESVDFVDVPQLGDAAFAIYDKGAWNVLMKARTGNAIGVAELLAGKDVAESWSASAPLEQQVPKLSVLMTNFLTGLS
ncbi:hypothetical protein DMB66_24725 [Actinoplanes sp. ATCC 53533]|uniref:hypothetical protein n=1 Tax=Actinoplanes sp. ATCC 53533 TaxID=1288362 RepID=UPI000F79DC44|nr:hypothetical protein [Actinoplanes sp. ATCC 53533]RSM60323.1 hypothetical protein DMB66_24725 [Actinoplanes sp. ATCC 53533]